jgi:hypothetical protein
MGADSGLRDRLLDQAAHSGATWVRANVFYGQTQGGRDLSKLNALVDAARARGLHVQATLAGDPNYLNPQGGLSYKNADPGLMAQFARTVAKQERGRIGRYSIWNEPNVETFLQGGSNPVVGGRKYRQLYRAGYAGIKGVDPGAQVLLGELTSPQVGHPASFLASVLAGKPIKTAGLALHPYVRPGSQWDVNQLGDVQRALASYKRQGKLQTAAGAQAPLYLTEFGVQRGKAPEAQRERSLTAAFRKAQQAGAREMLYYQLTPTPRDPGAPAQVDIYGRTAVPARQAATGWQWDTAVSPAALGALTRTAARSRARH